MTCILRIAAVTGTLIMTALPAAAQISFTTAVDLALKNSPRVKMAEADVAKAQAALEQTRDAYIPTVTGGSGLGPPSYGFPLGNPSVFNITSQSLVFNYSQQDYVRAGRAALDAAKLALSDVRQGVIEEAAITCIAVESDTQRQAALVDESTFAARLVAIVQDRLDAGQDTAIGLTSARLTAAQIRLARLRAEDEATANLDHLSQLTGLPARGLSIDAASIPSLATPERDPLASTPATSPAVESAYASARAKREIAFGDARYLWRPQVSFAGQYSRFAPFNNLQDYYLHFQQNNASIGVQINLPLFDMAHRAKARESAADAAHSEHEADIARDQFFQSRMKAQHTIVELAARAEVATLDQQLAQQQLDALLVEIQSGSGNSNAPLMTPKDEQTSRIGEREKYLSVIDAKFQLRQTEINLLRQTGELEPWLKSAAQMQISSPPNPN